MKVRLVSLAAVLLVALVFWRPWERVPVPADMTPVRGTSGSSPAADPSFSPRPLDPSPGTVVPQPSVPVPADMTPAEIQRIRDAIDNLEFVFRDYAAALGGNPVGTNPEITAALLGDNARQLKLEVPAGSELNPAGELCDPWGTPWFFHQLGGTKMEIRSAGADRALYTDDDFVR